MLRVVCADSVFSGVYPLRAGCLLAANQIYYDRTNEYYFLCLGFKTYAAAALKCKLIKADGEVLVPIESTQLLIV